MKKIMLLVLLVPSASLAQIYKCTSPSGHTTFSNTPCAGATQIEQLQMRDNHIGGSFAPSRSSQKLSESNREDRRLQKEFDDIRDSIRSANNTCKNISETQLRTLTIRSQVVPGMKISDTLKAWGTPERVNGNQYVYYWGSSQGSYFYEKEGCVRSVDGSYRGPKAVR